ncbi:MAG TPA: tRNA dihydrouridine(20/20a) synthase DusA [Candidatus Aquabacterium excrementipullorum]|nr:tRNA dihydrouridine(20/20a) synthase DusA [Candidatus Aquabacterium excrementipullorum]
MSALIDPKTGLSPWRACVAPMLDWTDAHCRYFHRQLSQHARLYTEMLTTGALVHGKMYRFLDYNESEHPVALQLGGSEPADLAECAKLALERGYDEVNLNCGCPSERVQRGAFGACLMNEASLVADCIKAMMDATGNDPRMPITVKHRIGIDKVESYDFVRDFVGTIADVGCQVFIVHARNAWLKGLSPKENRDIPPLRYEFVHRLKQDFPHLTIVLNGGLADNEQALAQLQPGAVIDGVALDGVMLGRAAYHTPWLLSEWDERFFNQAPRADAPTREAVEAAMAAYADAQVERTQGWPHGEVRWPQVMRHVLGLYSGLPGARRWRQVWSDHKLKHHTAAEVMRLAHQRPA